MTLQEERLTTVLQSEQIQYKVSQGLSLKSFKHSIDWKSPVVGSIVDHYSKWVQEPLYLCLEKTESFQCTMKKSYIFMLGAKRGNEVYNKRCLIRFNETAKFMPDKNLFSPENKHSIKKTNALLLTLTYNPAVVSSQVAWESIGKDFNLFLAKLRKSYKTGISQIRSWESHESGYPHIHALVVFKDHEFLAHWHKSKNPNWRISRIDKDKISDAWAGGFVDVIAVYNPRKAFNYLGKYLFKYLTDSGIKATLTRALTWYYQKRAFSLSRDLFGDLNTLSTIQTRKEYQLDLFGISLTNYEIICLGCVKIIYEDGKPPPIRYNFTQKNIPESLWDSVVGMSQRYIEKTVGYEHGRFKKIETGSVMSIEQLKSFFSGPGE